MAETASFSHYDDGEAGGLRSTFDPATGETHLYREIPINEDEFLLSWGVPQEQIDERRRQTEHHRSVRLLDELAGLKAALAAERQESRRLIENQAEQIKELKQMVQELRNQPVPPVNETTPPVEPAAEVEPAPAPEPQPEPEPAPAPETAAEPDEPESDWQTAEYYSQLEDKNRWLTDRNRRLEDLLAERRWPRRRTEVVEWARRPINVLGAVAAAGALFAAGIGLWNHHELEEQEGYQAKPGYVSPNGLGGSGLTSYFENSHPGGHGLQLDYPRIMKLTKNQDGTYTFKLRNGKTMKLVWNRQGKLTDYTIRALRKENISVGWAQTKFTNRQGSTYTHQYSVIGG